MSDTTQLERDSRIRTTALVILTFIAVAVALYFLRPVLLPFVLALFIGSGLAPVLNTVQQSLKSSRPFAIFATAVLSIIATAVLWSVIAVSVTELRSTTGSYKDGFSLMLIRISGVLQVLYPEQSGDETIPVKPIEDEPIAQLSSEPLTTGDNALGVSTAVEQSNTDEVGGNSELESQLQATTEDPDIDPRLKPLYDFFASRMNRILLTVGNELVTVLSSGLLVMIFLFFLLLGGSDVKLPENNIWREIDTHVRKYIVAKTVISAVTGIAFGTVLWLFGVPLAFVLGMLAFLLNFIPNLGPIIASLLPVPLVWMQIESAWATNPDDYFSLVLGVVVILLSAGVQFFSGNVVEPKIMGEQFRLHPIAILLSLMFWYMIWGLVGAFLAVPITSALKIMLGELDSTRPAADLLEGNLNILAKRDRPVGAA